MSSTQPRQFRVPGPRRQPRITVEPAYIYTESRTGQVVLIMADSDRTADATHEIARSLERSANR